MLGYCPEVLCLVYTGNREILKKMLKGIRCLEFREVVGLDRQCFCGNHGRLSVMKNV